MDTLVLNDITDWFNCFACKGKAFLPYKDIELFIFSVFYKSDLRIDLGNLGGKFPVYIHIRQMQEA